MGPECGWGQGADCEGPLGHERERVGKCEAMSWTEGARNAPSGLFLFLFADFNQEQMSEQANGLETSETTV